MARGEAEEARSVAETASRAKSDFLTSMSHELRTPLNAIAGHVQLIEMGVHGPVTAAQQEALSRVQRSQQHLLSLINDVLNLARIETGRMEYSLTEVPLTEVMSEVVSIIEPLVDAKGLSLDAHSLTGPRRVVIADRERLQEQRIGEREHCRVAADCDRQRQDGSDREARIVAYEARAVTKILPKICDAATCAPTGLASRIDRRAAVSARGNVAEFLECLRTCISRRHAGFDQCARSFFEVELELAGDVVRNLGARPPGKPEQALHSITLKTAAA